jgi:hypothetical protein
MLRFFAETYGRLSATKIIFTHAHDNAYHLDGVTIWDYIDRLVRTEYFRRSPFGNVLYGRFVGVTFRNVSGYRYGVLDGGRPWFNVTDMANYFFENTSFAIATSMDWYMTCCSTFFMEPSLILNHPRDDYLKVLAKVQTFAKIGFCDLL